MKKAFSFLYSLTPLQYELFGNPIIDFYDDYVEVRFEVTATIRSFEIFDLSGFDEFRMFPSSNNHSIIVVYTFYKSL